MIADRQGSGTASYRDLRVWQLAMDLVVEVFQLTRQLPHDQVYGLSPQLQRAALSIPANIAEGNRRIHPREYTHFLWIARRSTAEVETHLDLAARLGFVRASDIQKAQGFADEISRMLNRMIARLRSSLLPPPSP